MKNRNNKIIYLRNIGVPQAKKEIIEFMDRHKSKKKFYLDDVANGLGLDLHVAIKALNQLYEEGKIRDA